MFVHLTAISLDINLFPHSEPDDLLSFLPSRRIKIQNLSLKPPPSQSPDRWIVRQIEVEGGDGDIGIGHGLKICAPFLVKDELSAPDPIVLFSSRIYLLYNRTSIVNPSSLLGDLVGFDFFFVQIRNVDIEKSIS